ncbi:MAG TPA: glycoside hydrolase family 97 catalytic domain-containing protein [Bacteroidales bacterium]|nr:glycoside hydrolase family 97 catalytic domain-containing protein [Bacteroidales bacterium]
MAQRIFVLFFVFLGIISVAKAEIIPETRLSLNSPDGKQIVTFYQKVDIKGVKSLWYKVDFDGQPIVLESKLDIQIDNHIWELALAKKYDQPDNWCDILSFDKIETSSHNEMWKPIYGERSLVKDQYNAATIFFSRSDKSQYKMNIEVRAYNEGIAFRYSFPLHPNGIYHKIKSENTEFAMPHGTIAWFARWAQGPYEQKTLSAWTDEAERPLTLKIKDDLYACLTEAQEIEFPRTKFKLKCDDVLQTSMYSVADMVTPFATPWRVIMAAHRPGDLLENNDIILNLNEPNKLANCDWIKPGKLIRETTLTTGNAFACIDFSAKHNLQYILFDCNWYGAALDFNTDASKVVAPIDMPKVIAYGKEKGIGVWLYVNQQALQYQADKIFPIYKKWGVVGVKFGFVQFCTQGWATWLHELVRKAADNNLMVDIHDEYRPTGYSRTYSNLLSQEGIRGNEEFPSAEHNTTLPFTRMIAGAADYTVCYFDKRLKTTHAHQLALPVIFYSPLQSFYWYDKPSVIQEVVELEFFDNVPVTFDDTKVINDKIGQQVTIARRSGENWFVGTIGNDEPQTVAVPLGFLMPDKKYKAILYTDDDAVLTPTKVKVSTLIVDRNAVLKFQLKVKGGSAIRLLPATNADVKQLKRYKGEML